MKKLLTLLSIACLASACVDNDYDLSKIDTDDVAIGDETTTFEMPLATVEIRMGELSNDGTDIEAIFDEADIWLPSRLPGGVDFLDIARLLNESSYLDELLSALLAQLETDDAKLISLGNLAWEKYRADFLPLLPVGGTVTEETFKTAFRTSFRELPQVQQAARGLAAGYLQDLKVEPVKYRIDKIDIGSDVVDMLADNLDPKGTSAPKNTLHLYGKIESSLPVGFDVTPRFGDTEVSFSAAVEPAGQSTIPDTRIYSDDLRKIVEGTSIDIGVSLTRYYPERGFSPEQTIRFKLHLRKKGGLKLDL